MKGVSLAQANKVIAGAFKQAEEFELKPISVAVLDAGGHLVAFQRQDRSSNMRAAIAIAKASSALDLGVSSRKIAEMAEERPAFIASLDSFFSAGVVPAAGGVIIVDADAHPIGAVGVTGDLSDNDELCALAGIAHAGLAPQ